MVRDLTEFRFGSNEGCHFIAKRFPKMALNLGPELFFVSHPGLEADIAARNKRFDPGEAEELKLAPQSLHLHCPPTNIDCAEKSNKPRHAGLLPNDDDRRGADRQPENHSAAALDRAASR